MKTTYLNTSYCEEGQFSNEYAIGVTNFLGESVSGFFPKESVKESKLEVEVLGERGDLVLLKVPGRFIGGKEEAGEGCYITVKKEDIVYE